MQLHGGYDSLHAKQLINSYTTEGKTVKHERRIMHMLRIIANNCPIDIMLCKTESEEYKN